jgi:flagellar biosynthetic protein FliR
VLFAGVQVVSQVLSTASGMSLGSMVSGGPQAAPLTRFLDYLSMAIFLGIGGHRMVMAVILTTMREVPLGSCSFHQELVGSLASLLSLSFALGLRASFPVLVSLLTAIIVVGVLSRFLPRFQMFVSAAGLNSMVLVGSLFLFMGTVGWSLQEQIPVYLERLVACLETSM